MLLISHPFLTHSPVKAQLTPPTSIATSTPRIGIPARTRDAVCRLGDPEISGLGHYIDSRLEASAPRTGIPARGPSAGHSDDTMEVGGLGHYIDNRLGDDRFHIS